jgi:two-component system, cell cycle response regulator
MIAATVLLVTMYEDERAIYGNYLRANGYNVVLAESPEHALRVALNAHVVVTRILQPQRSMNGIELLRRLKQDPTSSHVPVIVITSLMQPEFRAEATAAGCDGYLLLPVIPDILLSEIRRVTSAPARTVA